MLPTQLMTYPPFTRTSQSSCAKDQYKCSQSYSTTTVTNINNNVRRQNGNGIYLFSLNFTPHSHQKKSNLKGTIGIFASYAESVISTACSCLVTTPVITKTVQTAVVQTTTDINTQLVTTTEIGTTTGFSTTIDDVTVTVPGATVSPAYHLTSHLHLHLHLLQVLSRTLTPLPFIDRSHLHALPSHC